MEGENECFGDTSYEALDMVAEAWDDTFNRDDWSKDLMGLTALVKVVFDNKRNCKFDKIVLDTFTYCFINDCTYMNIMAQLSINWPEIVYAFNMIWTTVVSAGFVDFSYENDYKFYHQIGVNSAILLEDLIGYKPKDGYDYDPDENVYAEQ